MSKEILMLIIIVLIALQIIKEGYLKGFINEFCKNLIEYKKIAIIGVVLTLFSIVYLDLPIARKFSNKYYAKTLQGIENGTRIATVDEIIELKKKIKVENIKKEKYSKYERFLAHQGDGDVTIASIIIILLAGSLLKKKKLIKICKNAIVSVIASGILVNLIKYIVSRLRPDVNMLPYQFFSWASWFNGNESINPFHSSSASFPSGHAIVSVAVASSFYFGYKNKVIRSLLKKVKFPLAIPSANKSGRISPVSSQDVVDEFGKKVKFILDNGYCKIGIESTVVDLRGKIKILRPGAISAKEIEKVIKLKIKNGSNKKIRSPGALKKHYSPGIKMVLNQKRSSKKAAFITYGHKFKDGDNTFNLSKNSNLNEAAKNLYKILRKIKKCKFKKIYVAKIPNKNIGIAINDRLKHASSK